MTPSQTAIEAAERIHSKLRRDEIAAIIQAAIDAEVKPLREALEKARHGLRGLRSCCDEQEWRRDWHDLPEALDAVEAALTNTERKKRR